MDLRKIKMLMDLVEASGITELEVHSGEESVRIVRPSGSHSAVAAPAPAAVVDGVPVRAPMAGTFYAGPEPGAEPFVQPGRPVRPGDVLCIIESMKMMNEIKADRAGVCTSVLVSNGQPVSAGEPLLRIA
jgi:acetyl-CoA carboxylase biotin carboxyl carrier protein